MTGYQSKRAAAQDKLAQPAQEPVANDRALQLVTHQLNHWVAYATELRERLNKYEGGAPMLLNTTPPQRPWVEPTGNEWFEWWRVSPIADETETEIDFADFLIIAQAVVAKLKELNNG